MERRKFLAGLGGTAIGASALIGSGAFTEVGANRDISVEVADDPDAFLGIRPANTPNGNTYAEITGDPGTVELNFDGDASGTGASGLSDEAFYNFEDVLVVRNRGSQPVGIQLEFLDEDGNQFEPGNPALASVSGPVERTTEGGWYTLGVGEEVNVGFFFNLFADELGDLLEDLDTIRFIADADEA